MRGPFGLGGLRFLRLNCASVAFGLFGFFVQKKKNKKTKNETKKNKKKINKEKKTKAKKKKKVCLFDIRYSFRFERFIIPLRVE